MAVAYRIQFAVPPGYQYLMAEIYLGNRHAAELHMEARHLQVVFYPLPGEHDATFAWDEIMPAVQSAAEQLRERSTFFV